MVKNLHICSNYATSTTAKEFHRDLFGTNHEALKSALPAMWESKNFPSCASIKNPYLQDPTYSEMLDVFRSHRSDEAPTATDSDFEYMYIQDVSEPPVAAERTLCAQGLLYHPEGHRRSCILEITNVEPYVVAKCPTEWLEFLTTSVQQEKLITAINATLVENCNNALVKKPGAKPITALEVLSGRTIYHYSQDDLSKFLKLYVSHIELVGSIKNTLSNILTYDFQSIQNRLALSLFECVVSPSLRWLIDKQLTPSGYIRIPKSALKTGSGYARTDCDFTIQAKDIEPWENKEEIPATLSILTIDIECVTSIGTGFPTPEKDPVIQISAILSTASTVRHKSIFTVNTCSPLSDVNVFSFDDEAVLLAAFRDYVNCTDPDIISGYNIIGFDLYYIFTRAQTLHVSDMEDMSRHTRSRCTVKPVVQNSKATGMIETKDIKIFGRVILDVYDIVRKNYKLKSYSLNAVSFLYLNKQKEDVHYTEMKCLQETSSDTRRRIASYCVRDSEITFELLCKLCLFINTLEMSRVTGVPMVQVLERGQQIRVTMQILRVIRGTSVFMPCMERNKSDTEGQYEGATVLEPTRGYYINPVAVLDFASLYPSIMIAHNICYTTLVVDSKLLESLPKDQVTHAPNGAYYVSPDIRPGILPSIVQSLLKERKRVRAQIKTESNPLTRMVLDGRQTALKVCANSVYGYTGAANTGHLPCVTLSESITAFGRTMIEHTKQLVYRHCTQAEGYPGDAEVLYGDTDSVMIDFKVRDVGEAIELGQRTAELITKTFKHPIELEFEKIFSPYLLLNKKRYAGLVWNNSSKYSKLECKGIETVRRDFCVMVQEVLEGILDRLLIQKSIEDAVTFTQERIRALLTNKIDISKLILSKSLTQSEYKNPMAHVMVAQKIKERDPAKAPQIGDRVYYVLINGAKQDKLSELAEDPEYALDNNLPINVDKYIESLRRPVERILEVVDPDLVRRCFTGEHLRTRTYSSANSGALSPYFSKSHRCLRCKMAISIGVVCTACSAQDYRDQYIQRLKNYSHLQYMHSKLWSRCQICQESVMEEVLCSNRDCGIFYQRLKVRQELRTSNTEFIQHAIESDPLEW